MVFNIRIVCVQLLMFLLITVNGQPYSFFMNPLMRFGRGLEQLRDVKQEISNQLQSKLRDSNLDYYYSVDGASNEEDMLQEQSKVQMRDADQPRDVICGGGTYDVVGTIYMQDILIVLTFDSSSNEHIVYLLDNEYVISFQSLPMERSQKYRMKEFLGYDPMKSNKPKRIHSAFGVPVYSSKEMTNLKIVLLYGEQHGTAEVLYWNKRNDTNNPAETTPTQNKNIGIVLGFDSSGYFFSKSNSEWFLNDMTILHSRLWIQPGQVSFLVGQDSSNIYFTQEHGKRNFTTVSWDKVNGFIMEDTGVNLFVSGNVYIFSDMDQIVKHSTNYIFVLPYTKVTYHEFFSCKDEVTKFDYKGHIYDMMPSNAKRRTLAIYVLFLLHFLVAAIMIILILLYSNPSTRPAMRRFSANSSYDVKRVRKSRKSDTGHLKFSTKYVEVITSRTSPSGTVHQTKEVIDYSSNPPPTV